MRPTYLQLRSPKERTEYTTDLFVSHNGTRLFHDQLLKVEGGGDPPKQGKSFCFAPSDRFGYYKFQEQRMPKEIGPGTYNPHESFKKLVQSPCAVVVKPLQNHLKETGQGQTYMMDGGLITKDPHADKIFGRKVDLKEPVPTCGRGPRRQIRTASNVGSAYFDARSMEISRR